MKVYFTPSTNFYKKQNSTTTNYIKDITRFNLTQDIFEKTNNVSQDISFKATFWKHITVGIATGASAGSAIGAKVGGAVDLGTAGTTLGVPTVTGTTAGGVIGGLIGGVGGVFTYFGSNEREKTRKEVEKANKKLEEVRAEIEQKNKALAEQQAIAEKKNQDAIDKQKAQIEELKQQTEILQKFVTKQLKEVSGVGLGRIAGYEEDKKLLNEAFISPYTKSFDPRYKDEALNIPNGVLLYGLSGNGKTTLAEGIIEQLLNTTETVYYDLSNIKRSELENKLYEIKENAQRILETENKRTIVFLDEFDGFAPNPSYLKQVLNSTNKENPTNSYLKSFMNNCSQYGITIIATTNNPQDIESPFIHNNKRFSVVTAIEPPNAENIKLILDYYLDGLTDDSVDTQKITDILASKLDLNKALYSCSKIKDIADKSKERARKEKRLISQDDLLKYANKINPNLKTDDIDKFKTDFELVSGMTYEEYLEEKAENEFINEE